MSGAKRQFGWKHALAVAAMVALAVASAVAFVIWSGAVDLWARRKIVDELEKTTGARVEIEKFHFDWRSLGMRLDGITLHGREPAGTPPLFHAGQLLVEIRVESFWGRRISLGNVEMSHFSANVRVESDGSTNFSGPKVPVEPAANPVGRLFDLKIAQLRFEDGEILLNDTRVPLVAKGGNFELVMNYAAEAGQPVYLGSMSWQKFQVAAQKYMPFTSELSAKFTLSPGSFSLTQLQWKIPHSVLDAQADLTDFSRPVWSFRYRGQFDFEDLRATLRQKETPAGRVDFTGDGRYAAQQMSFNGRYTADGIAMHDNWFHTSGISSRGSYHADQRVLDVPDLEANALGGTVTGRLHVDIPTQTFRFESQLRSLDLSTVLAAEDNPNLPINPFHWAGSMDVDATTTWVGDFKHVDSRGVSLWSVPSVQIPGKIPASARIEYHYEMDHRQVEVTSSEINTPSSHLAFHGSLGMADSSMDVTLDTEDLTTWDDFINRLRGSDAEPKVIAGRFHWDGRITGPLTDPTFSGQTRGDQARYDDLYWDELEGEVSYSSKGLRVARGRALRGRSTADLELSLAFDDWSFLPDSEWSFDANLVGADTDDIQRLFGKSYPAHGILTGQFHGKGTRAHPEFSGLFDVSNATAETRRIDRARGQLTMRYGEVQITNAEVRLPPHAPGGPAGLLTGNLLYHTVTRDVTFDVTGAGIPLESIDKIQMPRLPVGGQLNLQLRGQGLLSAPELHGTLRVVDLKLGSEVVGSFEGSVDSDGHHATATIESAMPMGRLSGKMDMELGGEYPLSGEITAEQIDFDPIITAALHLSGITGHSRVDGHFAITGAGARPDMLAIDANLSRITLDYDYVKLENNGPIRLIYAGNEVRIDQASLKGADTDFVVTGFARFAGDRALNLHVDGAVSLPLLAGFVPQLEASGRGQVDAEVVGTLVAPRFNGKVHVEGATLRYGDFPAGLSNLAGDFNFDATRIVLQNVTAESGGGRLTIGGAANYGGGPLNYAFTVSSDQVRIRYPAGMSWLLGGALQLSGNAQAATVSGRLTVDRLLLSQDFDFASFMGSSKAPVSGPSSTSSFLRNLQFDVEADSSPDSSMEWPAARFQTDANTRLRGTWEHPILLGHIHLLSGQMNFRGNQYTISRGDINFADPFRLDPVLNVEATATIQQYEVTLDFTGPASRLNLAYRSDPPLPSSEIIVLLALGQTGEEGAQRTATGQNSTLGASTLLSEAVSNQLGGRIQRLFGISHFSVGPSITGPTLAQQNSYASVTIQQQVTPALVVTYSSDVNSTQYEVIQVEYTINQEYSVVGLRDENGTFGLDIVRKTRFK